MNQIASPTPYTSASLVLPSLIDIDRSNPNGPPSGCGIPMLSFRILRASMSLSLVFGSRMAVRMLPPLTLRECDGVFGDPSSRFLEKLSLRVCGTTTGFVDTGPKGGCSMEVLVGEMGDETGVDDAIVPPTPTREVTALILRGAFLVIEHGVGCIRTAGAMRTGLCGEPMPMTKGILEPDAALSLRSWDASTGAGMLVMTELADPARGRSAECDDGDGGLATTCCVSSAMQGGATRTVDALESLRDSETCASIVGKGEIGASTGPSV